MAAPANFLGQKGPLYSAALDQLSTNVANTHVQLEEYKSRLAGAATAQPRSNAVMRGLGKDGRVRLVELENLLKAASKFELANYISKGQKRIADLETEKAAIAKKRAYPNQAADISRIQTQIDEAEHELNATCTAFTKAFDDIGNYAREWQRVGAILNRPENAAAPNSKRFHLQVILDPPGLQTQKPSAFAQWKEVLGAAWSGFKATNRFFFVDHPMATTSITTGLIAFGILCTVQSGPDGLPAIIIRMATNPERAALIPHAIAHLASASYQSIKQSLPEQVTETVSQLAQNYRSSIHSHLPSIETTMQNIQDQSLQLIQWSSQYYKRDLKIVALASVGISLYTGTISVSNTLNTLVNEPKQVCKNIGNATWGCAKGVARFAHGWLKHGYVTSPLVAAGAYRIVSESTGNGVYAASAATAAGCIHLCASLLYDQVIAPTKVEAKSTI